MRVIRWSTAGGLMCLRIAAVVLGAAIATTGSWGMQLGPHDLVASGVAGKAREEAICVFCHTPQNRVDQTAELPRATWASTVPADSQFIVFDPLDKSNPGVSQVRGAQSLACLSCHDGTQAERMTTQAGFDHPVGVPYRGVPEANRPGGSSVVRVAYSNLVAEDFRDAASATIGGARSWWVPTSAQTGGTRTKRDLPLYARGAETDLVPFVECATCHDPHGENRTFLRATTAGSGLCRTCHIM